MKHTLAVALLTAPLLCTGVAMADTLSPTKTSHEQVSGSIFSRPDAVKGTFAGAPTVDVVTHESADKAFQTGMYKSGPMREELGAPGTPYEEFLYFTAGGVTLTSTDGKVITVKAGESVSIPKGWTGVFETKGYEKIYAIYDAEATKK
ncbi:cupin domain-containing protein [Pseudomonas sp. SDO524_S393]